MQDIRQRYLKEGYSSDAAELMMSSLRPATQKVYNTYIHKWKLYADSHKIVVSAPSEVQVTNFLASLYKDGASYSTVNAARSALSAYLSSGDQMTVGSRPGVCRLVKGVFEERPALPKYTDTWDINQVLDYFCSLPDICDLSLKQLTLKTAMLLALLTGQRGHALHSLNVDDLRMSSDKCVVVFSAKHKQTKPGVHSKPAEIYAFSSNKKLCLVTHLKEYLCRTASLRKDKQLFLSFNKPHAPVARATFSRWVKETLEAANISTDCYGSHSTRAASCSAVAAQGVNLSTILRAAGWSSETTFTRFYRKTVTDSTTNFGQTVLDAFVHRR